ncbi:hypothetical protein AVEN_115333-1 [Araneus ventricosus]|uniref:Uncharacterized protein n=1 Tax=Araneus ventricosus TaxID=182803 RepID=A0A4Y1ZYP6_ARAVE|nr:hypothetical protein AVEN_115333-1 [Araneus ventricosus]
MRSLRRRLLAPVGGLQKCKSAECSPPLTAGTYEKVCHVRSTDNLSCSFRNNSPDGDDEISSGRLGVFPSFDAHSPNEMLSSKDNFLLTLSLPFLFTMGVLSYFNRARLVYIRYCNQDIIFFSFTPESSAIHFCTIL